MPSLASMAREGDEVIMGLEGDPLLKIDQHRATGVIESITEGDDGEMLVTINHTHSGNKGVYSSQTIKPNEVWEFTPTTLNAVMERERRAKDEHIRAQDEHIRAQEMHQSDVTKTDTDYR